MSPQHRISTQRQSRLTKSIWLSTLAIVTSAWAGAAPQLLFSDDFESYPAGSAVAVPYTPLNTGNGRNLVVSSDYAQSAFGENGHSQGLWYCDTNVESTEPNPYVRRSLGAGGQTSALLIQFDFKINEITGYPTFAICGNDGKKKLFLRLCQPLNKSMVNLLDRDGSGDVILPNVEPGSWYQVVIRTSPIQDGSETYAITVRKDGDAEGTTVENLSFRFDLDHASRYTAVEFGNPVPANATANFVIDNLSVMTIGQ